MGTLHQRGPKLRLPPKCKFKKPGKNGGSLADESGLFFPFGAVEYLQRGGANSRETERDSPRPTDTLNCTMACTHLAITHAEADYGPGPKDFAERFLKRRHSFGNRLLSERGWEGREIM